MLLEIKIILYNLLTISCILTNDWQINILHNVYAVCYIANIYNNCKYLQSKYLQLELC